MLWCRVAHLRETLKPKTLSYSFMSFFSRVLFPAPDGPLSTTGLGPAIAEGGVERRDQYRKQVGEADTSPLESYGMSHYRTKSVCAQTYGLKKRDFTTLQSV